MSFAIKLRPEIKEKWVAALRSGDYQQGTSALAQDMNGMKYCCLGVLCELAVLEGVIEKTTFEGSSTVFDGQISFPSASVGAWATGEDVGQGLFNPWVNSDSRAGDYVTQESLAVLNDSGHSFAQIANFIEEQM